MASRRNAETTTRAADNTGAKQANKQSAPKQQAEKPGRTEKAKTISVTFYVTAPEGTGKRQAVFLTGALHAFNPKLSDWDPKGVPMKRAADGRYTVTIKGTPGSDLVYKYTLGSWEQVELDAHCEEIQNRRANLRSESGDEQVINDTVQNWRGAGP